jgi:type I restriction enzyme S subunit
LSSINESAQFTELVEMLRPKYKVQKSEYLAAGALSVIDQGAGLVGGYTNDMHARFPSERPVIVFGDHTCRFKYVPFPFAAGADGTQIFRGRDGVDTRYLYYACQGLGLEHFGYQRHMKHLKVAQVPVWPLPIQRRIASILSGYDDLIETNTRRIAILEEMARRLYDEWFAHSRFPGHEAAEFVEIGGKSVPDGWSIKTVKKIVKRLKNGAVYKQSEVSPSGSTIVIDQSRAEYLGFHDNEADHEASPEKPLIIFGDHTCKIQLMVQPFSLGPNTISFSELGNTPPFYLFALVQGSVETKEYKRHWTELMKKTVVMASGELPRKYDNVVRPMFSFIEKLRVKNRNLRAQRDLLLPKLISGEIDVPEAENALGDAAA